MIFRDPRLKKVFICYQTLTNNSQTRMLTKGPSKRLRFGRSCQRFNEMQCIMQRKWLY